ncbi:hypothetical protein PS627_00245 [Pseudomonas fluorescens]|uniref:type VI secretion system protein TssA n=1 Tax=Pseudomonas fluorescens TaxID=294 RepID=UPI00125729A8|nr:type VI secretion system protein TssA [Pseudomonas fluorescens]CAG8863309.1 hypothetical protein PS627_00245 [Pseudomonas fluorescens]
MTLQTLIEHCFPNRDPLILAREHAQRWEPWLQPVRSTSPAGEDPGHDDDFQQMREEVNKLSGPDPVQVVQLAQKLLIHTCKDLRVATYYLWARLHNHGEAGLADGLNLLAALVDRYRDDVLPARPNSRKMALEWLASPKVLDTLSRYPQVVRDEAERTVAALAWLQAGLEGWPPALRPDLGALHGALKVRLAQSGGVGAVVPQNGASQTSIKQSPGPRAAAVKSGRDLLDSGRALADYLREQPGGWLAAPRLMKSLRWDTVHQIPPQDGNGITRLSPPRGESRAQLKRLYQQQNWQGLLGRVEGMYAEGVNHFWLDLQWYLSQALNKLPAPHGIWADIVKRDLGMFLERLPGLEDGRWSDGSPFADETTCQWIAQHVCGNQQQAWLPAPATTSAPADTEILSLETEAVALADDKGVEQALAWLAAQPEVHTGRQRWLLRLLMARVAEQYGRAELALHLLVELDMVAQRQVIVEWEPELSFEVKARLLKLLRAKALRSDVDKLALARRMDALLASLVAMDPLRAAVLCG